MGPTPRYIKSRCFDAFPFPAATPAQQTHIRNLGEKLDTHRKSRQALHPNLTMTGMYNVLEALRSGRELTDKEKIIHEDGLVTILRELHDELDVAVSDAYGWPADLPDEAILSRLVALNFDRTEEEKNGTIRWLRPEYQTQSKEERKAVQATLDMGFAPEVAPKGKKAKAATKQPWPSGMLEQIHSVRATLNSLRDAGTGITLDSVAEHFTRAPRARVEEILGVLEGLGLE